MPRGLRQSLLFAAVALAALGCSRSPEPCASAGTCPEGQECLANRCVAAGGEPVSSDSIRLTAEPSGMVVVKQNGEASPTTLPSSVAFGSERDGTTALYLRFPAVWRQARRIESAFLVLDPMPGTLPARGDVEVEAWRVREPWRDEELSYLGQPLLGPPSSSGIARSAPPSVLRIDVTEIVSYLHAHPDSDHGIALKCRASAGGGASYATGTSGGRAPRLEVYAR